MFSRWILAVMLCTPHLSAPGRASPLLSDNFTYPDGPLVAVSDGKWKTHSGTAGQVGVVSGEVELSQTRSEDVSLPFPGGIQGPEQAAALYARFKARFTALPSGANGGYFAHFKDAAPTTGLRCRIFATTNGATSGSFRLGIASATNAATALLPQEFKLGVSYRLACRMVLANNTSTLWVNPTAETDRGATSTDSAKVKAVTAFAFRQSLSSGSGMGEVTVDELKVATTFAETILASAPVIRVQPEAQVAVEGANVVFQVEAGTSEPLSYQWDFNGAELAGATSRTLELFGVTSDHAGVYQVMVSNDAGTTASSPVSLTVEPAELIVNISSEQAAGVRLNWLAQPDHTYSIWAGHSPATAFSLLTTGLIFPEGTGLYEEDLSADARFYRICSP